MRRLYDEARSRQQRRKLDFVLTSMIPWIAEKPWEFAYDAGRAELSGDRGDPLRPQRPDRDPGRPDRPTRRGPLRILVAARSRSASGSCRSTQEIEVIRRGFEPLIEAGLVTVDVLPRATPSGDPRTAVHRRLQHRALHRARRVRRGTGRRVPDLRGHARRRGAARRAVGARDLLPARPQPGVSERLPERQRAGRRTSTRAWPRRSWRTACPRSSPTSTACSTRRPRRSRSTSTGRWPRA